MGVTKCVKCRGYYDDQEITWISVDHNHDAAYCTECCPDETYDTDEDTYDSDEDTIFEDEE